MKKIFGIISLAALCSCADTNDGHDQPGLNVTTQNDGLAVTIENTAVQHATLLVNGKKISQLNESGQTLIPEELLQAGMNQLNLITKNDTLTDSVFFSYKIGFQLVKEYAHDTANFTEGLFLDNHILYESTGLEQRSRIARYEFGANGLTLLNDVKNDKAIFGEGISIAGNSLYQLSWQNHFVFEYDKNSLKKKGQFVYPKEGWGLTPNGDSLIASDGSATLYFIAPSKFEIYKQLDVKGENGPVKNINELELVRNIIVANVWQTNTLIFINKETGIALATADLNALAQSASHENPRRDVLNGIAYDPADGTFLVTGKFWTKLYRIKLDGVWDKLLKSQ